MGQICGVFNLIEVTPPHLKNKFLWCDFGPLTPKFRVILPTPTSFLEFTPHHCFFFQFTSQNWHLATGDIVCAGRFRHCVCSLSPKYFCFSQSLCHVN